MHGKPEDLRDANERQINLRNVFREELANDATVRKEFATRNENEEIGRTITETTVATAEYQMPGRNLRKQLRATQRMAYVRKNQTVSTQKRNEDGENGAKTTQTEQTNIAEGVAATDDKAGFEFGKNESANAPGPEKIGLESSTNGNRFEVVKNSKSRKSRVYPVNRAEAAAAIIMLAIGVIMLLLGPIIVILRALDVKRRERRYPKLSCNRDLPPSYEQATLMDQTPRYSTLCLNTITELPSSSLISSNVLSVPPAPTHC